VVGLSGGAQRRGHLDRRVTGAVADRQHQRTDELAAAVNTE
jgi:hypothetical protein